MESVVIVINAVGNVIAVFACRERADTFIRQLNCHPKRQNGGSAAYYDRQGVLSFELKQYTVQK